MASCSQVNSLFQAYIDGELGRAEKGILEEHLHECIGCRKELDSQQAANDRVFEALSDQRLMWGLRSRVLAHLPEMDAPPKYGSHPTDPHFSSRKQSSQLPWFVAGAAAVLVIVALAIAQGGPSNSANAGFDAGAVAGMVTYSNGAGSVRAVEGESGLQPVELKSLVRSGDRYETLDDGRLALALVGASLVKVNYGTALQVIDNRRVKVESGLTYFDIGHQKRHFYVDTPTGEIQVFGTAFVVDVAKNKTTVTVTEGDILVRNNVGIAAVSHGSQLTFTRNGPMPKPVIVNVGPIVAWADEIVPDPGAMELFRQTLEPGDPINSSIPAEPGYLLPALTGREIHSMVLNWKPDGLTGGHCSYTLHVSDGLGNLRMLTTIDSSVFDVPGVHELEVPVPDTPIEGVDVLHIKLIPDHTPGEIEVEITDVKAFVSWQ